MVKPKNLVSNMKLSREYCFAYNILFHIIPYLNKVDLVSCSKVCTMWYSIISDAKFWSTYVMRSCGNHLNEIPTDEQPFLKKIELYQINSHHVEKLTDILAKATSVEEIVLLECNFEFNENLTNLFEKLKVLKITQSLAKEVRVNTYTDNFYKSCSNLTEIRITSNSQVPLSAMENLKQLKSFYLDADYSVDFFRSELQFLQNLESFGVGYTKYRKDTQMQKEFNQQLSCVLEHMKKLKKLHLHGLKCGFFILECASMLQQLEILELGLINAWNYYSPFLTMCHNIKKLCIKLILPPGGALSVSKVGAQNSILLSTVLQLKNTLMDFTLAFDSTYMRESEECLAQQNNQWKDNYTVIWNNILETKPQNLTITEIQIMAENTSCRQIFLQDLEKLIGKELPRTKVKILAETINETCEFCPPSSKDPHDLRLSKIHARDREVAEWIDAHWHAVAKESI